MTAPTLPRPDFQDPIFDQLFVPVEHVCAVLKKIIDDNYRRCKINGESIIMTKTRMMIVEEFFKGTLECSICKTKPKYFSYVWDQLHETREISKSLVLVCDNGNIMTRDHIIPTSFHGADRPENFTPMCYNCNCSRQNKFGGDKDFVYVVESISDVCEIRHADVHANVNPITSSGKKYVCKHLMHRIITKQQNRTSHFRKIRKVPIENVEKHEIYTHMDVK